MSSTKAAQTPPSIFSRGVAPRSQPLKSPTSVTATAFGAHTMKRCILSWGIQLQPKHSQAFWASPIL